LLILGLFSRALGTMKKLGESTFAEVFHGTHRAKNVAVKIIPFGGTTLVNGFPQTHPDDGWGFLPLFFFFFFSNID
jgi:hypothetical protein